MLLANNIYRFENLSAYSSIAHGISTKAFGSMKRVDDLQIDRDALTRFALSIGITNEIVCMGMVHGGVVTMVDSHDKLRVSKTDALITAKNNLPLAVSIADCLPILFYDPRKEVIGIAHAGYKGLLNHIIENAVVIFVSKFKSNPSDIIVGIGPCIEMKCYEVGEEVIEKFEDAFPKFKNVYIKRDGKFYLDLRHIALQCLQNKGILKENIEIMDICTKCDGQFYSYRGGDGQKRFVSLISLILPP